MVGEKIRCRFCRNEYSPFNVGKHEEKCAMNPTNGVVSESVTLGSTVPKKETDTDTNAPLMSIRNIIILPKSGLVARFKQEGTEAIITVPIEYIGAVIIGEQEIASLLIIGSDGILQPPFTLNGFVGIFKEEEPIEHNEPELEPESKPEPVLLTEEDKAADIVGQIQEIKDGL